MYMYKYMLCMALRFPVYHGKPGRMGKGTESFPGSSRCHRKKPRRLETTLGSITNTGQSPSPQRASGVSVTDRRGRLFAFGLSSAHLSVAMSRGSCWSSGQILPRWSDAQTLLANLDR